MQHYFTPCREFGIPNKILCVVNALFICLLIFGRNQVYIKDHFLSVYFSVFFLQGIGLTLFFFLRKGDSTQSPFPPGPLLNMVFRYSLVALLANGLYFLVNRADYWFVQYYCSPKDLGNYIQASKLGQMLLILPSILGSTLFPIFSSGKNSTNPAELSSVMRLLLWINGLICLLIISAGWFIFPLIFGPSFSSLYLLFLLLVPGILSFTMNYPLAAWFSAGNRMAVNIRGALLALVIICIGDWLFLPNYGVWFAPSISSAGYFCYYCYAVHIYRKTNPVPWNEFFLIRKSDLERISGLIRKTNSTFFCRKSNGFKQEHMKKVLWLASWYPNASDPFSGDFIKRQAEAVSVDHPLKIVYVGKYSPVKQTRPLNTTNPFPNLEEHILYYSSSHRNNIFSSLRSFIAYFKKHLELIRQLRKNNELPDIVHVHVAMKSGLIALYLKWKFRIPYLVTEHWTGYYRESADSLFKKSWLSRWLTRQVLKNAFCLLPVSEALGKQINRYWVSRPFRPVPNVVDTRFFSYSPKTGGEKFRFIHVSTMNHQKNPEGIIRSFAEILKKGLDAELILVGPVAPSLREFIHRLVPQQDKIFCTGEITYEQVSSEMKKASALVLFSFYENLPCVILEALCSGLPFIATGVGGIPELIQDNNGLLVDAGNEEQLLEAMKTIMLNEVIYDRKKISIQASARYSYETVGKIINQVYDSVPVNA